MSKNSGAIASPRRPKNADGRSYLSQKDIPRHSLSEALRVPQAIYDNYAGKSASPLQVAKAMDLSPDSGGFRTLCGAAIAYGLIEGGAFSATISTTPLAKRIIQPTEENDDLAAKREASLRPKVIGEFLRKYHSAPLPKPEIAQNVLIEMGVPKDRAAGVFEKIVETAEELGFLTTIKDKRYVELNSATVQKPSSADTNDRNQDEVDDGVGAEGEGETKFGPSQRVPANVSPEADVAKRRRVFVTHGKNQTFLEPIKQLLHFGELEAVVSVERQSVSQPVPDKVLEEMRSCGAAIIHVDAETRLLDQEAKEHVVLNPNVLIEIGAAMALFGRRFILLVREGVTLPSNLQGLFEVRYQGEALDGTATIKLLGAINEMKSKPLLV